MNSLLDFPRKLRISHDLGILRATTVESATSACMDLLWSGRGRRVGRSVSLAAGTGRSLSGLLANGLDRFAEHLPAVPSCVGTGCQQVRMKLSRTGKLTLPGPAEWARPRARSV